jgi:hypothetical protein
MTRQAKAEFVVESWLRLSKQSTSHFTVAGSRIGQHGLSHASGLEMIARCLGEPWSPKMTWLFSRPSE